MAALKALRGFIGPTQAAAVKSGFSSEEKQFFFDKMVELAGIVETMPKTYDQSGKGDDAIVSLHYFAGGQANWYITEKDCEEEQLQAFGLCDLFGDGGELGYVSLVEVLRLGGELDFYFTPKPLREVRDR